MSSDSGGPTTLLICDDHKILTDALAMVVERDGSLRLVAPPVHVPEEAIELCEGIANKLFISPQTVQTHVRNLLSKLGVHSKLEAVAFAVKHGWISI